MVFGLLTHTRAAFGTASQDYQWWLGTASNATLATMAEMGRQSTRLVADVIFTAWVLANSTTDALSRERDADTFTSAPSTLTRNMSDFVWAQKVQSAAEQDRMN